MDLNHLEGAILIGGAQWLTENATTLEDELKPLEMAAAGEIATVASNALKNVPIVGALVAKAIAADEPAMVSAFQQGVASGIAALAAWAKAEGEKLSAA